MERSRTFFSKSKLTNIILYLPEIYRNPLNNSAYRKASKYPHSLAPVFFMISKMEKQWKLLFWFGWSWVTCFILLLLSLTICQKEMILSSRTVVWDLWMANAEQAVVFIILRCGTSTSLVKCHKMHTSVRVYVFFNSNVLFCNSYRTESCKGREKLMASFSLF